MSDATEPDYACEVCGNSPDETGDLEHGRGCYKISEDGGGSEYVEEADKGRDSTNERPGEAGWYEIETSDRVKMARWWTGKEWRYHRTSANETKPVYPDAIGFARLVPASELTTLQADCERWSREYARQADELLAVKAQLKDALMVSDVGGMTIHAAREHIATLTARLAEVEQKQAAELVAVKAENERLRHGDAPAGSIFKELFPNGHTPTAFRKHGINAETIRKALDEWGPDGKRDMIIGLLWLWALSKDRESRFSEEIRDLSVELRAAEDRLEETGRKNDGHFQ